MFEHTGKSGNTEILTEEDYQYEVEFILLFIT